MSINLEAIRARVKSLDLFKSVGDVVDATHAMNSSVRTPAAFVATAVERATPNTTQAVHDQKVEAQIAVLFVVAAERKAGGQADVVEQYRAAIVEGPLALTGWTPPGARRPLNYAGFRIVRLDEGLIWAECTFTSGWAIRK